MDFLAQKLYEKGFLRIGNTENCYLQLYSLTTKIFFLFNAIKIDGLVLLNCMLKKEENPLLMLKIRQRRRLGLFLLWTSLNKLIIHHILIPKRMSFFFSYFVKLKFWYCIVIWGNFKILYNNLINNIYLLLLSLFLIYKVCPKNLFQR